MAVMQIFVSLLMPGLDQITIRQSCGCTQLLHVTKLPVTDTSYIYDVLSSMQGHLHLGASCMTLTEL